MDMVRILFNALVSSFRRSLKNKGITILKACSLVLGGLGILTLMVYCFHEINHDEKIGDNTFRLTPVFKEKDELKKGVLTTKIIDDLILAQVPEVKDGTRFIIYHTDLVIEAQGKLYSEKKAIFSDKDFFKVFNFDFLYTDGDPSRSDRVVISKQNAIRFFGRTDVVGEALSITLNDKKVLFTIAGVLDKVPTSSHLDFGLVLPGEHHSVWNVPFAPTSYFYINLLSATDKEVVANKISALVSESFKENPWLSRMKFELHSMDEIYFDSNIVFDQTRKGNLMYVKIMLGILILVLTVTAVNEILLSSSQWAFHQKEIAIRRVFGSSRKLIFSQYFLESIIFSGLCAGVALLFYLLFIKQPLQTFFGIGSESLYSASFLFVFCASILIVTVIGAMWSGIQLRRDRPGSEGVRSRQSLGKVANVLYLSAQTAVGVVMIFALLVVNRQLNFMAEKGVGYDLENVIVLTHADPIPRPLWSSFQKALSTIPSIENIGSSQFDVIGMLNKTTLHHMNSDVEVLFTYADEGLLKTLNLPLILGRDFSAPADSNTVILNEEAVRTLGDADILNKKIVLNEKPMRVVGICKNFHSENFDRPIEPTVLVHRDGFNKNLYADISTKDAIKELERAWKSMNMPAPFEMRYLRDDFKTLIKNESGLSFAVNTFTVFMIVIASIGLINMILYFMATKNQEIGIRKVYGATVKDVLYLFNKYFVLTIIPGIILGLPIAKYAIEYWLLNFAYKESIRLSDYILAIAIPLILVISLVTICSWRTSNKAPVASIRNTK